MKFTSIFVLLGILIASLLNSCTSSSNRTENRYAGTEYPLEYFDQIKLEGGYTVEIQQGDEPSLIIKASENDHKKIAVSVENDVLYVKKRSNKITTEEIKLEIIVSALKRIDVEGGVYLTTIGYIEVDELNMLFQGGAHVRMQTKAELIKVKTEGGANIELEGVTDQLFAVTEGAGNIDADKLKARVVTCRVSGVGNATVYATDELNATIEGVGRIGYRGDPAVNKTVSGIGTIHRR